MHLAAILITGRHVIGLQFAGFLLWPDFGRRYVVPWLKNEDIKLGSSTNLLK